MRQWRYHPCQCFSREARVHVEGNRHTMRCPDCGKTVVALRDFDPQDEQDIRTSLSEVVRRWNMGEETKANLEAALTNADDAIDALEADPTNTVKDGFAKQAIENVQRISQRLAQQEGAK